MSILKCGQKDNKNYTFGVRKEQLEEQEKQANKICCAACGTCVIKSMKYCPSCGEAL